MVKIGSLETSLFLTLFLLSLVLSFFDRLGFLRPARSVLQVVSIPLDFSFFRVGQTVKREIRVIWELREVSKKYLAVQESLSLAQAEIARLSEVEEKNKLLLAQLGVKETLDWNLIPANVVGLDRYLRIDRGEKAGVAREMAVVFKNILIGKIVEVSPNGANVQLISDPEFKIPAKIGEGGESRGLLSGRFHQSAFLEKILPERKLEKNDLVLTVGSENIPANLLIGAITEIEESGPSPFQGACVDPALDFAFLQTVFVVKAYEL
jgi:rod shape-determining protein MreC